MLTNGEIEFFISAEGRVPDAPPAKITRLGWLPLSLLVRSGHPALRKDGSDGHYPVLVAGETGQLANIPANLKSLISGPRHIIEDCDILAKLTERSNAIWISSSVAVSEELAEGRIQELMPDKEYRPLRMRIAMYSLERRLLSPGALKLKQGFQRQMRLLKHD
jgi:DNA-binding transcriptional LysR family regulator